MALNNTLLAGAVILLTAVLILFLFFRNSNQKNKGVILALIFIMLLIRVVSLGVFIENKTNKLVGSSAEITAEIVDIGYSSNKYSSVILKIKDSSNKDMEGLTVTTTFSYSTNAIPGDIINAEITFVPLQDNFRSYNFGKGYHFAGNVTQIYSNTPNKYSFWRFIYNVRTQILNSIEYSGQDDAGAVLKALIIGDDADISNELYETVKATGVSHMLVVSGMHLSLLCGIMMNIVNGRIRLATKVIVCSAISLFILAVCLFHISILRASIAYFVMLFGRFFKRTTDPLSSLGFGIVVAVFSNPYIFYNVAFLLSLAATFAVLYPSKMLIDAVSFKRFGRVGKLFRSAYDIFVIATCSMVCTLPIIVYYFGYVALASPIANLAVTFAMNSALVLGVLAIMLFFLPFGKFISLPCFFLARAFVKFFISVITYMGKNDFGVVRVSPDKNIYCFFIACAFILLVRVLSRYLISKRKEKQNA
ncbi:MAG: ComEC/Rec2 family competence protein [Clostridia bacterium]|nr:ComEC/Rec2 family competence protein [Clostridia bacterium]